MIDGTDFYIYEPGSFNCRWYSHKSHGPVICYEIGVWIQTGWIVLINGPFAPGDWSNLNITWYGIAKQLDHGEKYLADRGYRSQDGNVESPTGHNNHDQWMKARARAQPESVNALFKQYQVHDTERQILPQPRWSWLSCLIYRTKHPANIKYRVYICKDVSCKYTSG